MQVLKIKEVIQAGDVLLIRFLCPRCRKEELIGYPPNKCPSCLKDLTQYVIDISNLSFRALTGTVRKKVATKKMIKVLKEISDNNCSYCEEPLTDFHIDHVVPISFGGTNNLENLRIACSRCNLIASDKVFPSFYEKYKYVMERRRTDHTQFIEKKK